MSISMHTPHLTGEVIADWLDEHSVDVIASDRASVRWSDPDANKLLEWGKKKIRQCLEQWVTLRSEATLQAITVRNPEIQHEIDSYKGVAREELVQVVDRVVSTISHIGTERTQDVITSIVNAYRHDHIREVLVKVIEGKGGYDLFFEALKEWDLINAVLTFEALSVKLSAIATLRALILGRATEVKSKSGDLSLHEHLAEHPWLIDPMYSDMEHERNVDLFILEKYGIDAPPDSPDKRIDFIVLYDSERIKLVEIKSAKSPIDERGMVNFMYYHDRIEQAEALRGNIRTVRSLLVYNGTSTPMAKALMRSMNDVDYKVNTWQELLDRNTVLYKEQLKHVRDKNPDDPRVINLWDTMQMRIDKVIGASDNSDSNSVAVN